jgi:anti-anti-sigma factor
MSLRVIESGPDLTVVAIDGRLDALAVGELRPRFLEITAGRAQPVLVDIAGVTFLASLGIWMFVEAAKALQPHGAKLVLLAPNPLVEKTFRASGFTQMVHIHHDPAEARRELHPA